jgi:hypothetical protein
MHPDAEGVLLRSDANNYFQMKAREARHCFPQPAHLFYSWQEDSPFPCDNLLA